MSRGHFGITRLEHTRMMELRQHVLDALTVEMEKRDGSHDLAWVRRERYAMADAANRWLAVEGIDRTVTSADVELLERQAMGHSDYASKVALYVAEFGMGWHA